MNDASCWSSRRVRSFSWCRAASSSARAERCRLLAPGEIGLGLGQTFGGFVERRGGGSAPGDAEPPARRSETIAVGSDHDRHGVADGDVDRVGRRCHTDGRRHDDVEQALDRCGAAAHVRTNRFAARRCRDEWGGVETQCQDGTLDVRVAQRLQCPTPGGGVGDHDGQQRVAECCFDGRLPAVVDLDQVEQRAEGALDSGQVIGTRLGACRFERQVQRLGASPPARQLLGGLLSRGGGDVGRGLGCPSPRLGCFDLGHQGCLGVVGLTALRLESIDLGVEPIGLLPQSVAARLHPLRLGLLAGQAVVHRAELAANLGRGSGRRGRRGDVADGGERRPSTFGERLLFGSQQLGLGSHGRK